MTEQEEPKGRQKGGIARKDALSPERRKAIAERAAAARWGTAFVAIKKGNFSKDFGIDVDCYVLNDATRTAVISQRGMGKAIGLTERGNSLPRFLAGKAVADALGAELVEKFKNSLKFQWGLGGAEQPPTDINGFDAAMLIDLCKSILRAYEEGKLGPRYKNVAKNASIVLSASAKAGIKGLVYALAGYSPTTDEVIQAFKLYVQEEAKKYESEFPQELYDAWLRLYQITPLKGKGKPWEFMHLTINHVYHPLAQSNGKVLELLRALRSKDGTRGKKLFQFLNTVGARALRMQIGRVLEMAEDSEGKDEYEARFKRRFGGNLQQEFDL